MAKKRDQPSPVPTGPDGVGLGLVVAGGVAELGQDLRELVGVAVAEAPDADIDGAHRSRGLLDDGPAVVGDLAERGEAVGGVLTAAHRALTLTTCEARKSAGGGESMTERVVAGVERDIKKT